MKNTILIILLLSTTIIACSKKKVDKISTTKIDNEKTHTRSKTAIDSKKEIEVIVLPFPIEKEVLLIAKINRAPCFGKCPVFTIELYDNGIVKYNGINFVDKKGIFTATADSEFIAKIQSKALSINYLSFENKYPIAPIIIADLPTTTTFIRIGEEGKQITDNFDAPRDLIDFENWLESQFEKLDWQAE